MLLGAELLFVCRRSQEPPPEGLPGATVVGHWVDNPAEGMGGKWAGQETGPGSTPVGKTPVGGTRRESGSERTGPGTDPEAGSWSEAGALSGSETVASERGA